MKKRLLYTKPCEVQTAFNGNKRNELNMP